jgi:hypothetical protein
MSFNRDVWNKLSREGLLDEFESLWNDYNALMDARRFEAAKAALTGLLTKYGADGSKVAARTSVEYADALLVELKKDVKP